MITPHVEIGTTIANALKENSIVPIRLERDGVQQGGMFIIGGAELFERVNAWLDQNCKGASATTLPPLEPTEETGPEVGGQKSEVR